MVGTIRKSLKEPPLSISLHQLVRSSEFLEVSGLGDWDSCEKVVGSDSEVVGRQSWGGEEGDNEFSAKCREVYRCIELK